jgi:hypothetical protein
MPQCPHTSSSFGTHLLEAEWTPREWYLTNAGTTLPSYVFTA